MREDGIERQTHLADALVAGFSVLAHGRGHDGIKTRVEALHEQAGQLEDALRKTPGEHLVEHDAHRVDVRAVIHATAEREGLRCHEMQRAHDVTSGREAAVTAVEGFGQAEVCDLHLAVNADHDVGGFDVAVHNAVLVGVLQRVTHVRCNGHGMRGGEAALAGDRLAHVRAVNELHDEKQRAIAHLAEVEDLHDARVVELRHGAGLLLEALQEGRVMLAQLRREDFDGDGPLQRGLDAAIHRAHAATSEEGLDDVAIEPRLEFLGGGRLPEARIGGRFPIRAGSFAKEIAGGVAE